MSHVISLSARQISKLERPYWTKFWGQRRKCKPRLVRAILGAGDQLIYITPLMTRPHHYILRVDKSWMADDEATHEHLEEIENAIEEEFGWYNDGHSSEYEHTDGEYPGWPVYFYGGICWGVLDPKEPGIRIQRQHSTNRGQTSDE